MHTVLFSLLLQSHKNGKVFRIQTKYHGSILPVGEVQLLREALHLSGAFYIQSGHQGARGCVESGMDDGRIGLGSAAADILLRFQYTGAQGITGKLSGNRATADAGTDQDDVKFFHASSFVAVAEADETSAPTEFCKRGAPVSSSVSCA